MKTIWFNKGTKYEKICLSQKYIRTSENAQFQITCNVFYHNTEDVTEIASFVPLCL